MKVRCMFNGDKEVIIEDGEPCPLCDVSSEARGFFDCHEIDWSKTNRILWNKRDEDIDEIVLADVATVHIEQMTNRCWWIGITLSNGGYWAGNFTCGGRGRMRFSEQDCHGFDWVMDDVHE